MSEIDVANITLLDVLIFILLIPPLSNIPYQLNTCATLSYAVCVCTLPRITLHIY